MQLAEAGCFGASWLVIGAPFLLVHVTLHDVGLRPSLKLLLLILR